MSGKKKCACCGKVYPRSKAHFWTNKFMPGGLNMKCKSCMKYALRERFAQRKADRVTNDIAAILGNRPAA